MATTKPRVNVVLDAASFAEIEALAERHGCSLSEQVRSMVLDMLELLEDRGLASAAAARRKSLRGKAPLSHADVWGTRAKGRR